MPEPWFRARSRISLAIASGFGLVLILYCSPLEKSSIHRFLVRGKIAITSFGTSCTGTHAVQCLAITQRTHAAGSRRAYAGVFVCVRS